MALRVVTILSTDPGLLARIWEYLFAAGIAWWASIAGLLAVERYIERLFHNWWKRRVDPWFTPVRRKQALILFAILAFLYANFRAFDEQAGSTRTATNERIRVESERETAR